MTPRRRPTASGSPSSAASARQPALPPRPRDRPGAARLRSARQGPAGGLGGPRRLPAIRLDARRQSDRDLGQGKIWRVDVAGGQGRERPFTARVEQTVYEAVRFAQEVQPEEFPVKALRDVGLARRQRVAYSALGQLYVKELPERRSRSATDVRPRSSSSPLVTRRPADRLHDVDRRRQGPRPRHRPRRQRRARVVTAPGHYTEPSFSPTASGSCYRATGGDGIRGPLHG